MSKRVLSAAIGLGLLGAATTWGQAPPPPAGYNSGGGAATARVETVPVELTPPERYQIALTLVPSHRAWVTAPEDGAIRTVARAIGDTVRDGQEIAQLDRAEANARLKIAQAAVKERKAELDGAQAKGDKSAVAIAQARLEAAEAQAELAKLAVDRCTLKAPFAGRVLAIPASAGQTVAKGTAIAEVADVNTLNVLVPVDRNAVKAGATIDLTVEDKTARGKVLTMLPLTGQYDVLRELSTPWAGAWVEINNTARDFEPGQRVKNPYLPAASIAALPARAVRGGGDKGVVQVIRYGFVEDVPVTVLGTPAPERMQVAGAFRPNDAVVVEASPALAAGTFVQFNGAAPAAAAITPPTGGTSSGYGAAPAISGRVAPIGNPNRTTQPPPTTTARPPVAGPAPGQRPNQPPQAPPAAPANRPAVGGVPF